MFVVSLLSAAPAAGESSGGQSLMSVFKDQPYFLSINLVVSAIVIAMVIERAAFQLGKYRVNSKEFFAQIKKLVTAGNIDRAIKLCDASDYPILQLVKSGLTHANKGPDEIDAALSEKLSELKPAVEKRVAALWSLANIATLIGLIGTVTGLIMTFNAVAAVALIAAMSGSTRLYDSPVTFRQALAACAGALGSISFAAGHARIAAAAGVDSDESPVDNNGTLNASLQDAGGTKSAKITIDQRQRTIAAKNVRVVRHNTVACILPD